MAFGWGRARSLRGRPGDLGGRVCCLTIAILGQLYVAMLIGLILGRFHQTTRR